MVQPLKQISHQPMAPIEGLGIHPIKVPHHPRQIGLPGVQHQVIVIAHLAIRQYLRIKPLRRLSQQVQVQTSVLIVHINRPTPISP